jgi:hypothetical protein
VYQSERDIEFNERFKKGDFSNLSKNSDKQLPIFLKEEKDLDIILTPVYKKI